MKLSVLLSILLFITTTLSAQHELEHITHDHESDPSCLVYHINDKLSSVDIIDNTQKNDYVSFEDIVHIKQVHSIHTKKNDNHSTAPPILS
ncbi:hypothetical protein N9X61_02190 [Sulfurimonas sp.]|nr:hypothetical protein [Sulfurimonas sp.]